MIWKYGPGLWKLGKDIYDDVESRSLNTSESKAIAYNRRAEQAFVGQKGYMPRRRTLNEFREAVWKYRNPGKTAMPLMDARLRVKSEGTASV